MNGAIYSTLMGCASIVGGLAKLPKLTKGQQSELHRLHTLICECAFIFQ